jgi:hypothetical protein
MMAPLHVEKSYGNPARNRVLYRKNSILAGTPRWADMHQKLA